MTRRESFRLLNALTCPYRWSAISRDRNAVIVSLWRDEFVGRAGAMVYEKSDMSDWVDGPAKSEFFRHLKWAFDHCEGIVRVVVAVRDLVDRTRTSECYPAPRLALRIAKLDPIGGKFRLEQVIL